MSETDSKCTNIVANACGGIQSLRDCQTCVTEAQPILKAAGCDTDDVQTVCTATTTSNSRAVDGWDDSMTVSGRVSMTQDGRTILQPCADNVSAQHVCSNMYVCPSGWVMNETIAESPGFTLGEMATCNGPGASQKIPYKEVVCLLTSQNADGKPKCTLPPELLPETQAMV